VDVNAKQTADAWGLGKLKEVLGTGSEPHLMTGEQYRESLRDGRRVIDSNGEIVNDVTTHPHLKRSVDLIAETFDSQFDSATQEITTYRDFPNSPRYARGWQVPTKKEHLLKRRQTLELSTMKTLGVFGRPPDYGSTWAMGFLSIADKIESDNPAYAENVRNFIELSRNHNLISADVGIDVQSDRRIPRAEKSSRLHVVEQRPDGLVLSGAKACASIAVMAHFSTVATVFTPDMQDVDAIFCAVPINAEGLTLLLREPTVDPGSETEDHPLNSRGEELDNLLIFDHVFVPNEFIFGYNNKVLLELYSEFSVLAFWHILARLAYRAQIFAAVAQTIVDILGTESVQSVRNSVSEIIEYAAMLKAAVVASEADAYLRNEVLIPSNEYLIPGRLLSTESYPRALHLLRDLSGQGIVSRWPKGVWENQEMRKILEEYLPGIGVTAREKNRFFNFVWDLCCSGHSARVAMFEHNNATPPAVIREAVYKNWKQREEMCKLVRSYAGINPNRVET
jgi:4-hydroxyphenylacetate 3-monooxygenase